MHPSVSLHLESDMNPLGNFVSCLKAVTLQIFEKYDTTLSKSVSRSSVVSSFLQRDVGYSAKLMRFFSIFL